jgi:hypothetical protein
MSTTATTAVQSNSTRPHVPGEMRIYTHTGIFYWWPVWVVGFAMAVWTMIENRHVALVPTGAIVEGNTIVIPEGATPILTPVHMSASRVPGMVFVLTVLILLAFGSGWMRGWRAYTFTACVVAALLLVNWVEGWDDLARWATYLQVHINLGGYLILSSGLLALWLFQVLIVDRRKFVVFSLSQVRVHNEIGEEEKAYDTIGIAFEKEQYDWFRRLVGFGAGDLRVRVGGQWIEIRNVLHVGRRLDAIEKLLRTKDVD